MISKHTKILFLVAMICIGAAQVWQRHSQMAYDKSGHSAVLYNLDLKTGTWQTNRRVDRVERLRDVLGSVGMLALLLALPLLVNDFAHRRQHN